MTPLFCLSVAGVDITGVIASRLLTLTLTDEAGLKSDALDITLDDRDARIARPAPGAVISVSPWAIKRPALHPWAAIPPMRSP